MAITVSSLLQNQSLSPDHTLNHGCFSGLSSPSFTNNAISNTVMQMRLPKMYATTQTEIHKSDGRRQLSRRQAEAST